ncbi:hypothetical protein BD413DRAFT_536037 [Trametes elegans]|nr:hypothetical protein BD413DRAFT_536037 [Trametes elegans]
MASVVLCQRPPLRPRAATFLPFRGTPKRRHKSVVCTALPPCYDPPAPPAFARVTLRGGRRCCGFTSVAFMSLCSPCIGTGSGSRPRPRCAPLCCCSLLPPAALLCMGLRALTLCCPCMTVFQLALSCLTMSRSLWSVAQSWEREAINTSRPFRAGRTSP